MCMDLMQMRTDINFIVSFITIIFFWYQTYLNSRAEGLILLDNGFYRMPRYKRSSENEVNENNVEDNEHITHFENIHNPNSSMVNTTEIINNLYLDQELIDDLIENWRNEFEEHVLSHHRSQIPNENLQNYDIGENLRQQQRSLNSEMEIFDDHVTSLYKEEIQNLNEENVANEWQQPQFFNVNQEIFSEIQPIENYEEIRIPINLVNK